MKPILTNLVTLMNNKIICFPLKTFFFTILIIGSLIPLTSCEKESNDEKSDGSDKDVTIKEFSVMSFNIRHDNPNDPQRLEDRKHNILKIVIDNSPDIIGFQEYSNDWFETWMKNKMNELGYGAYLDASAGRSSPKVIFYKRDRFEQRAQGTVQMNFTENRTGTWVILYDQINDQAYFISNSHWTTVSSRERLFNVKKLMKEVLDKYNDLPVILFGDFNSHPGTPEIQFLEDSKDIKLTNAHKDNTNTFTGFDRVGRSKLDWIFYSDSFLVIDNAVIRTSFDGYWPSDHWPIIASFKPSK